MNALRRRRKRAGGGRICARAFIGGPPPRAPHWVRHVGRGTLGSAASRTRFVMTAGHDRRRLRAGAGHRLLAHGRSLRLSRVIRAFSRVMRACAAARSCPSRAATGSNVFVFSRVTRSVTPARVRSVTPARVRSSRRARDLSSTPTRAFCLGERSVARCCARHPGRRAVDRQPRRERSCDCQ